MGAGHAFVVPAHGEPEGLPTCLDSLKAQTSRSPIVLATSTPNRFLYDIASRYKLDLRVNQTSAGIAADWNFALAQTDAEWVTLAHQDDWYAPAFVERCLAAAAGVRDPLMVFSAAHDLRSRRAGPQTGLTMDAGTEVPAYGVDIGAEAPGQRLLLNALVKRLLCEAAFLGQRSISSPARKRRLLAFGLPVPCPAVTLHRRVLATFRFDEAWRTNLDWAAWLTLVERDGALVYVREALVHHRLHDAAATSVWLADRAREDDLILRRLWPPAVARVLGWLYGWGRRPYQRGRTG